MTSAAASAALRKLLDQLSGVRQNGDGWVARCPAHEDKRQSFSITERGGKILLNCFAGCRVEQICTALGITVGDLFSNGVFHNGSKAQIVATYDYVDEQGTLLYQNVRYMPKHFRQRRPDGKGGWAWNLSNVRRVPYRLPEILTANFVLVCEGEKDCETARSFGIVATNSKNWRPEFSGYLRGKAVAIIADADAAGRKIATAVAQAITGDVALLKVFELPGNSNDLSDWVGAGGNHDALQGFIETQPKWNPAEATDKIAVEEISETEPERRTDAGNAEYFAARHGARLLFDHRRGRWLLWESHHWKPDTDAQVRRLAKLAMRQRFKDAGDIEDAFERNRAAKWAISSESRARLDALLYLAQAEHPIADSGENWDQDPFLLGVPNGVVNLRNCELRPGRREDRISMQTSVPYNPKADCPRFLRFLTEVFGSDTLIDFIQRAAGYSLTGATTEQCLFLCYGRGANGKGTFANTLKWALGDYGWNMPFATVEMRDRAAIPNDVAALSGRRFVVASETNDGTRLNESRIKALTGCDPITARFLHREFFEFEPVAKFWLSVNHKPIVRDDSHGFWRRIRLIPFTKTFPVNPSLGDELRAEGAGILAWAVRGCLLWQEKGLQAPEVVLEATEQYAKDSDPLADFTEEACELDPEAETAASELFVHYKRWADHRGLGEKERMSRNMFGRKIGERFAKRHTVIGAFYEGITTRN